ncbi:Arm DNA-binding domain-containing protein [Aliamphritea spongicola]|nr:Arm DNA-binding domain-containing protein [Aliamphritea spongicola]
MSKKFNPTNDRIRSLPANDKSSSSTELEVTDTELTGLKCLSGKSGNKRFLLRYTFNGRKRSINLGRFPDIDVAAARKAIRSYRAMLAKGRDPKGEQEVQQQIPTVSEFFWHTFLPLQKKHKKTWKSDIERFKLHIEPLIGHLRYTDLKTTHVQQIQLKLNEPTKDRPAYANATCNRVLAVLKSMGQFAVRFDIVPVNEAMKIKLLKEDNVRTRFLDAGKMKALIREALAYKRTPKSMRLSPFRRSGTRNSEMLNGIEEPYRAVSVTTDGFLTNAPLNRIRMDGPACQYFRELYRHIDTQGEDILEKKSRLSDYRGQNSLAGYSS